MTAAVADEARLDAAVALWSGAHLGRGWRAWLHCAARNADHLTLTLSLTLALSLTLPNPCPCPCLCP